MILFRSDRLIEWRKKKKLTQEQLAVKVNITKAGISNYENGHSAPPHETLVALADFLGITTDYLLGRTDDPTPNKTAGNEEDAEFETFIRNPEHGIFFKEYLDAPEERKNELMQFWRIIKEAEKGRKLGDRQGE
ncbi:helix-turn-helix transcriptional regulator [Paenibacillus alvei]|uniref:Helix-turn-helix transcriptional regulator n=1 Tax=Paenibacillus alvei TaxID=44250 RepID=A0AAP7A281_PAEAL|nr:helix-turn-helix transcriptional regulator [Paenibacillus alvei]